MPPDSLTVPHRVEELHHDQFEGRQVLRFAQKELDPIDGPVSDLYPSVLAQRRQHRPVYYFLGALASSFGRVVPAPARRDLPLR